MPREIARISYRGYVVVTRWLEAAHTVGYSILRPEPSGPVVIREGSVGGTYLSERAANLAARKAAKARVDALPTLVDEA